MLKIYLSGILLLLSVILAAQDRYKNQCFNEASIKTETYANKNSYKLLMDIYSPQNDSVANRPLIIFMHGGGFFAGKRNLKRITSFCTRLARYGYVAVSISYRLTRKGKPGGFGCNCPVDAKINAIRTATEDLEDAVSYLVANRQRFGINPQKIILAGSSAGAETVLTTAFRAGNWFPPKATFNYAGVISISGAITDTTTLCQHALPSLLIHGTADRLVPYATAAHHYCDKKSPGYLILYGSYTIAQKLNKQKTPYWLYSLNKNGHEITSLPLLSFFDTIINFCYNYIIKENSRSRETMIIQN